MKIVFVKDPKISPTSFKLHHTYKDVYDFKHVPLIIEDKPKIKKRKK